MNIVSTDPIADPRWAQLIERVPSSVFHTPAWLAVLQDTYGMQAGAYMALDEEGEPLAGLPFCRVDDFLGERLVSLPFSDYCDPLVCEPDQWRSLAAPLLGQGCPVTLRCLHNDLPLSDERFSLAKRARWHSLDLRPDVDTLWQGIDEASRRAIRKARRAGLVVRRAACLEELHAFFDMHLRVRKHKYRLLAQPALFLESIWRRFVEAGRGALLLAYYQDQPIGGILFLEWKGTLVYKFNASASADLGHRPNDLLLWEGIVYGKSRGCTSLDFGLSDWDQEGLIRYKRKFATEEKTISFLRHTPDDMRPPPGAAAARAILGQLTDLLTDPAVPDGVTARAGEILYRYFV